MGLKPRQKPAAASATAGQLVELLSQNWGHAVCELDFKTPFELLIATILSAQSTDKRVNMVTPVLFARFPDARALAAADVGAVEAIIHSTGFFRQKAKNIVAAAQAIVRDFSGEVPQQLDQLVTLPGVARKTANVVLGTAYRIPSGVVVDTHVKRVSKRLGLTASEDPVQIEDDLRAFLPKEHWIDVGHQLIWHGRRICHARKPACQECPLLPMCPGAVL